MLHHVIGALATNFVALGGCGMLTSPTPWIYTSVFATTVLFSAFFVRKPCFRHGISSIFLGFRWCLVISHSWLIRAALPDHTVTISDQKIQFRRHYLSSFVLDFLKSQAISSATQFSRKNTNFCFLEESRWDPIQASLPQPPLADLQAMQEQEIGRCNFCRVFVATGRACQLLQCSI